jgi:hypothetical protein
LLGCGVAIVERGSTSSAVSVAEGALHDRGGHLLRRHLRDRGPCLGAGRRSSVRRRRRRCGRRRGRCRCNAHSQAHPWEWCYIDLRTSTATPCVTASIRASTFTLPWPGRVAIARSEPVRRTSIQQQSTCARGARVDLARPTRGNHGTPLTGHAAVRSTRALRSAFPGSTSRSVSTASNSSGDAGLRRTCRTPSASSSGCEPFD